MRLPSLATMLWVLGACCLPPAFALGTSMWPGVAVLGLALGAAVSAAVLEARAERHKATELEAVERRVAELEARCATLRAEMDTHNKRSALTLR